jgi:hypothetical protein
MAIAILDHSIEISTPVVTLELSGGKESKMDLTKFNNLCLGLIFHLFDIYLWTRQDIPLSKIECKIVAPTHDTLARLGTWSNLTYM